MDTLRDSGELRESVSPGKIQYGAEGPGGTAAIATEANRGELVEILWRGRWIILAAIVVAIGAAVFYLQSTTPLYSASSQIYVDQSGPKILNDGGLSQESSQTGYFLATQCEVIKSMAILSIAAENPDLSQRRTFEASDNLAATLKGGLSVERGKMNDIITVSYECPSPEDAAAAANAVVDAYKRYNDEQRHSTAAEVLKILEHEYKDREAERDEKMKKMVDFRQENGNIELDDRGMHDASFDGQKLQSLTQALTAAQLAEADASASYALAKAAVSSPQRLHELMAASTILSGSNGPVTERAMQETMNPEEFALQSEIEAAESQLEDLSTRLLPDHPDVKFLRSKIARLTQQLTEREAADAAGQGDSITPAQKQFADSYLAAADQRLKLAQAKVQTLNDSFMQSMTRQQQNAINSNNKAATYALLVTDFHRAEDLCDQLDAKMKEVHVGEDTGSMNVTILEVARPSMVPSKPQKGKTLAMAVMLGLTLGMGLAFLNGWMDQRFRSMEDVSSSLGLPVLGAVPQMPGREPASVRGQKAHLQPVSAFAEACRAIRTAIYFGMPDSRAKTLLVTSPLPGDGKSTAASNLAIVMAQAGQKTLILDADFRRPNQHRIFKIDPSIGVCDVLDGKMTLDQAIQPSGIKGVDMLACGPSPTHPSEVLNSQKFADLLQELAGRYDHVVIDSPPIMPVTDARILGAVCDATIFVVRAEKSTRKVSVFARDVLQSVGTNILGVMVNGLSRGRGYYDAAYYQYGYGNRSPAQGDAAAAAGAESAAPQAEPTHDANVV